MQDDYKRFTQLINEYDKTLQMHQDTVDVTNMDIVVEPFLAGYIEAVTEDGTWELTQYAGLVTVSSPQVVVIHCPLNLRIL